MQEKVIGFNVEPKLYRVGSFVLKQVPGTERTLDEPDPTMKVLEILGLTNPTAILDMTIARFWDNLEATGRVRQALSLILTIEEKPDDKQFRDHTVEQVLKKMTRRVAAEVLKDFFSTNFGSTPQSGVTADSTTSS